MQAMLSVIGEQNVFCACLCSAFFIQVAAKAETMSGAPTSTSTRPARQVCTDPACICVCWLWVGVLAPYLPKICHTGSCFTLKETQ